MSTFPIEPKIAHTDRATNVLGSYTGALKATADTPVGLGDYRASAVGVLVDLMHWADDEGTAWTALVDAARELYVDDKCEYLRRHLGGDNVKGNSEGVPQHG